MPFQFPADSPPGGGPAPSGGLPGFNPGGGFAPPDSYYPPPMNRFDPRLMDMAGGGWGAWGGGSGGSNPGTPSMPPVTPPGGFPALGPGSTPTSFGTGRGSATPFAARGPAQPSPFGRRREDWGGYSQGQAQGQTFQPWGESPVGQGPQMGYGPGYDPGAPPPVSDISTGYTGTGTNPGTLGNGSLWIPSEGDFRLASFNTLNPFMQAGYFDPRGNRMLIEAGRMNAARVSGALQRQANIASQMYGLDPAQAASFRMQSMLGAQGEQSDAMNNALMDAYRQQADFANQMMMGSYGAGARRERYRAPSAADYVAQIAGGALGAWAGGGFPMPGGSASTTPAASSDWVNSPDYVGWRQWQPPTNPTGPSFGPPPQSYGNPPQAYDSRFGSGRVVPPGYAF